MRQRILEYARQQFATVGYSNVSTSRLASDLKISKSTLYKYFTSKEELLHAVIDAFYDAFEQEIQAILEDDSLLLTGKVERFLLGVRNRFAALHPSVVDDIRRSVPEAYARLEERRRGLLTETLLRLFEQGAEDGIFRTDVPPLIIVNVLIQALQYLEDPQIISGLPHGFADLFRQVFSVIMEGSLSEKGREMFR